LHAPPSLVAPCFPNASLKEKADDIPYRARKTAKRVAATRHGPLSGAASGSNRNQRQSEEDYVFVDVDPLDPFSPGRARDAPKWTSSPFVDNNLGEDDWIPIAALLGVASVVWLFGVLSNAIPAAAPSLGM
jgi:hypothetical protein